MVAFNGGQERIINTWKKKSCYFLDNIGPSDSDDNQTYVSLCLLSVFKFLQKTHECYYFLFYR